MSYNLNSIKRGYIGDYIGDYYIGVIKGDTRSLDSGSCRLLPAAVQTFRLIAGIKAQGKSNPRDPNSPM